jgi:hypothetical protein
LQQRAFFERASQIQHKKRDNDRFISINTFFALWIPRYRCETLGFHALARIPPGASFHQRYSVELGKAGLDKKRHGRIS